MRGAHHGCEGRRQKEAECLFRCSEAWQGYSCVCQKRTRLRRLFGGGKSDLRKRLQGGREEEGGRLAGEERKGRQGGKAR